MLDASDARDPDRAYRDYLEMCRRLSIEPMARERADELGAEFVSMLTGHPMPPAKFSFMEYSVAAGSFSWRI